MQRIINVRLRWLLEKHNIVVEYISGFKHDRSTIDQLVCIGSFVRGHHVIRVYVDLQKAYNTSWKYGTLKYVNNLRIKGRLFIKKKFHYVSLVSVQVQHCLNSKKQKKNKEYLKEAFCQFV